MDLYSTAELRKVIVNSTPPSGYFMDRLYPSQVEFTSEEILFDKLTLGQHMAPFVAPNVQGRVRKRSGFYTRSFRPAYVKPKDAVDPSRMIRRMAGEALTGSMSPQQRWKAVVAAYQLDQRNSIYRRWEWMCARAALDGEVTVSGEDYPTVTISFGRDSNHTVVLTGADAWDDPASTPIADINTWTALVADAEGFVVTRITMGTAAWGAFSTHADVKELLETRRGSTSVAELGPNTGEKVRFGGRIGVIDFYVYSDVYEDDAGVKQPMMNPKDVFLEAEGGFEGTRCFGAILDFDAGLQALSIFSKMWKNEDPSVIYLLSQSAPLMVPGRPNCTLKATVLE